jgi:hypothetical protein
MRQIIAAAISFILLNSCAGKINYSAFSLEAFNKKEIVEVSGKSAAEDAAQSVVKHYYNLARNGKFSELEALVETNCFCEKSEASTKKRETQNSEEQVKKDAPNSNILNNLKRDYLIKDLPELIYEGKWSVKKIETLKGETLKEKPNIKVIKMILAHQIDASYRIAIVFRLFQSEDGHWKIFESAFSDVGDS